MITVIGLGFVGLTTGLGFAKKGFKVYGVDVAQPKVDMITSGKVPFYEPYLEEALKETTGKTFFPTTNLGEAITNSELVFLCVGTPSDDEGRADLGQIFGALSGILAHVSKDKFKVMVIKSTIPPSTTKEKIKPFIEKAGFIVGSDIGLANNPEFLREGYAWDDFINPDRIVVGTEDDRSRVLLEKVYAPFEKPFYSVSWNTGEYIKYLSNTLLATLISYANEQSMLAHAVGDIDVSKAFKILHQDKRWSGNPAGMTSYVYPGCGFGGYCLPKDTAALNALAGQKGYQSGILQNVILVNAQVKAFHLNRIISTVAKSEAIAILGLAFKAESDDVRDTPAWYFVNGLLQAGFKSIRAYDPLANHAYAKLYNQPIDYFDSMESAIEGCQTVVVVTAWKEFKDKTTLLKNKNVFDLRYALSL